MTDTMPKAAPRVGPSSQFQPAADITSTIIASGLADMPVTNLVEVVMERLVAAGVPLHRMHVGFRILHPLFDGMSIAWTEEDGVDVTYFQALNEDNPEFTLSPFYWMIKEGRRELPLRLDTDPFVDNFPLLQRLRGEGFADYLALIVTFGDVPLTTETHDGVGISWSTKNKDGFSERDLDVMGQILAPLALALRVVIKDQITKNALNTFHGPLVGGRILSGTIKRGDGERLTAALWYSDLRNSTGLADQLSVEGFLDLLNVYFDCAAGAVMEEGGQVLDIVGDAILAFFPCGEGPKDCLTPRTCEEEACTSALRAAARAQERLAAAKAKACPRAAEIAFGIGVHFGDVVFGNAGTPERLKFGVIGRAVNEVARMENMSKLLGQPVVASDTVVSRAAANAGLRLHDLGPHDLRGIPDARRLWALRTG